MDSAIGKSQAEDGADVIQEELDDINEILNAPCIVLLLSTSSNEKLQAL